MPSRLQPGSWYALPQSPQLFKQLLMMSGYERYYQIARCFRDEDLRADRQPEFTQLDLEMGFVEEDDVLEVTEAVMHAVFQATGFPLPPPPWPRMTYDEAMLRFGSDRPDRRFGLEIADVSDELRGSEFRVFESVLGGGGAVRALNAGAREMSRSELDGLNDVVRRHGGKAVAYGRSSEDGAWRSPIAKFFSAEQQAAVIEALGGSEGDLLLFVADEPRTAAEALGALRLELGRRFGLIPEGTPRRPLGRRLPDVRARRGRRAGTRCTTRSRRRRARSRTPARCSRAATTSSSTAGSSAAGRSVSTRPRSSARSSRSSAWARRRPSGASASCSTRCKYGAPPHGGIAMGIDRVVALIAGARLDPRRHRVPEDRERRRPDDGRAGAGRRRPAARARRAGRGLAGPNIRPVG